MLKKILSGIIIFLFCMTLFLGCGKKTEPIPHKTVSVLNQKISL